MPLPFIETFIGMLTSPKETIKKSSPASLGDSIIYFLIVIFIYSVLSAAIALLLGPRHPMPLLTPVADVAAAVVFLIGLVIGGTIALLIIGLILHICLKIVGGSGNFTATVRAFALAETPAGAIGWIPVLGLLAGIWGFILLVMGAKEYHQISTLRAVIAIILPIIVIVLLIVLAVMFYMVDPGTVTITEATEFVPRII